ncbi:MAG: FHA domain-containing protein [Armatimonadetes bacterium]|nr:FHA domain-containing protein [Armatimonadota bacterium]
MPLEAALAAGRYLFLGLLTLLLWQLYQVVQRDLRAVRRAAMAETAPAQAPREPRLVVERGPSQGQAWLLRNPVTIGRSEGNDLRLEDQFASSHHARVYLDGQTVVVEDLGSTNGTVVNGGRIVGAVAVTAGARIEIGGTTLRVEA